MTAAPGRGSKPSRTISTSEFRKCIDPQTVSEFGTGIPEHKLGEIFKTFFTTKEQGTGLGLSVARTIVETYEGKIRAENQVGGGDVFRFT
jgi:signal transduction histidine kinase